MGERAEGRGDPAYYDEAQFKDTGAPVLRNVAMDALMDLIKDLKAANGTGKTGKEVAMAQDFQRKAQFYLDFVEAENSTGFHAPQEAARILNESIDFSRRG